MINETGLVCPNCKNTNEFVAKDLKLFDDSHDVRLIACNKCGHVIGVTEFPEIAKINQRLKVFEEQRGIE